MKAKLARAVFLLLTAAVAAEIGLRLWDLLPHHMRTGSLYDSIVVVGTRFKMRPDTAVRVPERYGDVLYRFNHEGYRDADHDPKSPHRRIVWLGDSVSFGLGVAQEETFVGRLQRRLAARPEPWEIVNLAIFAYDTRHELLTLREDGLPHHPDRIVLQFYMNDLTIAPPRRPGAPSPPAGWRDRLTAAKNRFVYKSAVYLRVQQAALGLSYLLLHDARRRYFPDSLNADEPRSDVSYLTKNPDDRTLPTFQALAAIAQIARERQIPLLVLISPDETQLFTDRYDLITRRVAGFCRQAGIAVFDPLPALRAGADRREIFYDGVHYSPHGHERLAGLLWEALDGGGDLRGISAIPGSPAAR
jgi:lysophospholipase L1-like esterase